MDSSTPSAQIAAKTGEQPGASLVSEGMTSLKPLKLTWSDSIPTSGPMSAIGGATIVAARIGVDTIVRPGVVMSSCSVYLPGHTWIVSPGLDASIAAWIVWK